MYFVQHSAYDYDPSVLRFGIWFKNVQDGAGETHFCFLKLACLCCSAIDKSTVLTYKLQESESWRQDAFDWVCLWLHHIWMYFCLSCMLNKRLSNSVHLLKPKHTYKAWSQGHICLTTCQALKVIRVWFRGLFWSEYWHNFLQCVHKSVIILEVCVPFIQSLWECSEAWHTAFYFISQWILLQNTHLN